MKQIRNYKDIEEAREAKGMADYILTVLRGTKPAPFIQNGQLMMTERLRQFWTWGAHNFVAIAADGGIGLQMDVNGLKHRGRVRVYYNRGTDTFDVELLRARKEEAVKEFTDVYVDELQALLHSNIERDDDPKL